MAEKENQFQGVVESLLRGMDTVLSTKTVVGQATKIGETIILPLVDVSFGMGAGAGGRCHKGAGESSCGEKDSSCGAGGLGGKMTPSAVLVIRDGTVKLVNVKNQDAVTKVLDMVPDLMERFTKPKSKGGQEKAAEADVSDAEAVDIAFPEGEEHSKNAGS